MNAPKRPAWVGWAFLGWAVVVLAVYLRQLAENASALGLRLP
jgi:hypothetical protein